jgi:NitT/TauT family transport system ATP-binding protein
MEIASGRNLESTGRPRMKLILDGIWKTFEADASSESVLVLREVSCRVEEGRFVSFVGPSGCGKTTLLRIIAGLEPASRGRVLMDEGEISPLPNRAGLVFQEYALFPWRTTLQNIEMGLEIKGISKKERRRAAMEYVKVFGLSGFEHRYPYQLSGGMQQRVAIARTLIMEPRIVLMDEPFGSLDSQTRTDLQEFLVRLWQERGDTILFVTHNVEEAVFLSDEVVVLSKRPASIVERFEIDLPRPRDRTGAECNALRKAVLKALKKTTGK